MSKEWCDCDPLTGIPCPPNIGCRREDSVTHKGSLHPQIVPLSDVELDLGPRDTWQQRIDEEEMRMKVGQRVRDGRSTDRYGIFAGAAEHGFCHVEWDDRNPADTESRERSVEALVNVIFLTPEEEEKRSI